MSIISINDDNFRTVLVNFKSIIMISIISLAVSIYEKIFTTPNIFSFKYYAAIDEINFYNLLIIIIVEKFFNCQPTKRHTHTEIHLKTIPLVEQQLLAALKRERQVCNRKRPSWEINVKPPYFSSTNFILISLATL